MSYEFDKLMPNVDAGYSGNLLDPAKVHINKALGRYGAIPPFFIPRKQDVITQVTDISEIKESFAAMGVVHSQMPFYLKRGSDKDFVRLSLEPIVSISGRNIIIRRTIAKHSLKSKKGTIKECWAQDDYSVTIQGVITCTDKNKYPTDEVKWLKLLFDERYRIDVDQEILRMFGIFHLAIESVSFPHTKGMNNQNFEIKAYSDHQVKLLEPINPNNGTE